MKGFKKTVAALFLAVALTVTALPFYSRVEAATLVYSTESNSGTRHVVCTTLDGTSADEYYVGDYTYDKLDDLSEDALFDALQALMRSTHTKIASYDNCRDMATKVDSEQNNGKVTLLYTSYQATRDQYGNTGTNGWNREHVWPKSLGGNSTKGGGADMHHIRPADAIVNSTRNNNKYGNATGGNAVYGRKPAEGCLGGYLGGGYYEPLDNVKGDVARICLYMYVRWNSDWSCDSLTKVFESVEVLLEWCELDPVDTWEMGRNEVVGAFQGNRNVFIDYPELAWLMLGYDIPEGMTTPSGKASAGDPDCKHTSTEIKNKSDATCGKDGYTGDTHCKDCGKKISSGTVTKATGDHKYGEWVFADGVKTRTCLICGHKITESCTHESTEIKNKSDATCAGGGYTGDTYCKLCGKKIASGTPTDPTNEHIYDTWITEGDKQTSSCTVCGKEAERPLPECSHSETETIGDYAPTCGKTGYSGDTQCRECGTVISEGEVIPATGEHKNTELRNEKKPTCGKTGYSGDTYCLDCGNKVADGEHLPATGEHFLIEGEVISEPTEKEDGLRLDKCVNCNYVEGVVLPKTGSDSTVTVIIAVAAVILVGAAATVTVVAIKKKKAKIEK